MTGRVVGLDLSLTSTGLSDCRTSHVIRTGPGEPLESRLEALVEGVKSFVLAPGPGVAAHPAEAVRGRDWHWGTPACLAVVEASAWSRTGPGHEELAALRIMVRHRLWRLGVPYALVPPSSLKLATAGYGKASKTAMATAVRERYGADFSAVKASYGRYDMVDAYALAEMGYSRLARDGWPAVDWPDLLSD